MDNVIDSVTTTTVEDIQWINNRWSCFDKRLQNLFETQFLKEACLDIFDWLLSKYIFDQNLRFSLNVDIDVT